MAAECWRGADLLQLYNALIEIWLLQGAFSAPDRSICSRLRGLLALNPSHLLLISCLSAFSSHTTFIPLDSVVFFFIATMALLQPFSPFCYLICADVLCSSFSFAYIVWKKKEKLQVEMLGLSEGVNDSKGSREGEGESVASEGDGGRRDSELPSAARRRCTFLVMTACSICSPLLLLLSPPSFPFSITGHLHLLIELFCH